jgi:hypothetical protein
MGRKLWKKLQSQQVDGGSGCSYSIRRRRGAQQTGKLMNLWAKHFGPVAAGSRSPGPGGELPLC